MESKPCDEPLRYITNATTEMYLSAIHQNPIALRYVVPATDEMFLILNATPQKPIALQYIPNITAEMCLNAVLLDGPDRDTDPDPGQP